MGGRDFDELPRYYRTERGARQAAARLTGDKLVWKAPDRVHRVDAMTMNASKTELETVPLRAELGSISGENTS